MERCGGTRVVPWVLAGRPGERTCPGCPDCAPPPSTEADAPHSPLNARLRAENARLQRDLANTKREKRIAQESAALNGAEVEMLRESLRRSAERLAMFREDEEEVERLRERETAVVTENEMLREDNERLREALEKIAGLESVGRASDGLPMIFMRDEEMREIARAARSPDQVPEGEGVMGVTLRDAP